MKTLLTTILILILNANYSFGQNKLIYNCPIELNVQNEFETSTIHWNTQKEVNSAYFVIESSNDNKTFNMIAQIKAAGYSLNNQNYELELNEVDSKDTIYRVTLVSMEGQRISCSATNTANIVQVMVANR